MTKEEKQMLLITLCGMLPYGVKGTYYLTNEKGEVTCWGNAPETVTNIDIENSKIWTDDTIQGYYFDEFKPYLRPMSSMTKEEREEFQEYVFDSDEIGGIVMLDAVDWLLAHHFDFRGLIEKGLALEAPEDMYKTK